MRVFGVGLAVVLAAGAVAAPGPSGGRGGYGGGGPGGGCGYGPCPTATATATATASATPTATTTPPQDTAAPLSTARLKGGQTARSILKKGLILRVDCSENCTHVTQLFVDRKTARKLRINRKAKKRVLVGKRTTLLQGQVAKTIRVKLNKKAKRGVKRMKRAHVRKLKLTIATSAKDASNNVRRQSMTKSFHR